jgi:hypothetical protein
MTYPLYSTTALEKQPPEWVAQIKYIGPPRNSKNDFKNLLQKDPLLSAKTVKIMKNA